MKIEKAKDNKPSEMPFLVDHKLRVNIETQVTDGIRQAILSGFYKPGDFLPKAVDLTRGLHVSFRATKADLPDAFLFTDDYLARGALLALLAAGIHTGRDVLVITLANKGTRPLHPHPIDLVLCDTAHNADIMADALIAYLDSGTVPGTIALKNAFVAGESDH